MARSPHISLKRAAFGALSLTMVAGALAFTSSIAGSQNGGCPGSPVAQFGGTKLGSFAGGSSFATSESYAASIPAGTYDLRGASHDAYEGRDTAPAQLNEKWFAQMLDANGNVLATSGTSADLPDGMASASWAGGMGLVTLSAPATQIRVVHAHQTTDQSEPNSVFPTCLGFSLIAPTTTSTTPPPVVTTAPPVVAGVIDTTTPTSAPTPTPSLAPAPAPSPAKPSFTG